MKIKRKNEIRDIEMEFGFYIKHKNYGDKVRCMAEEISNLRKAKRSAVESLEDYKYRVVALENQIANLDRRLNG